MDELINAVKPMIEEEMERANRKFRWFASDHEGAFVLEEEIYEARQEVAGLMGAFRDLKTQVFEDKPQKDKEITVRQMYVASLMGACELIQVAAMCKKFTESWERTHDKSITEPNEANEGPEAAEEEGSI